MQTFIFKKLSGKRGIYTVFWNSNCFNTYVFSGRITKQENKVKICNVSQLILLLSINILFEQIRQLKAYYVWKVVIILIIYTYIIFFRTLHTNIYCTTQIFSHSHQ